MKTTRRYARDAQASDDRSRRCDGEKTEKPDRTCMGVRLEYFQSGTREIHDDRKRDNYTNKQRPEKDVLHISSPHIQIYDHVRYYRDMVFLYIKNVTFHGFLQT